VRPFRVLHLNSARKLVGEAAHVLELCRILGDRGHRASLAARRGYVLERKASEAGIEVLPLRMESRFRPIADLSDARAIARYCRENDIEVLHAHRGKGHWLAAMAQVVGRLGIPLVRTRHVVTPQKTHFANRWLMRRTRALLCVSGVVAHGVRWSHLYDMAKVRTVPAGVDLGRFRPGTDGAAVRRGIRVGPDDPVAVLVARFHRTKGHEYVVEAAGRVVAEVPSARILFVGEGTSQEEVAELVRRKGLDESVLLLGWRDDVAELLHASDVGLLASTGSEGSSRAVMEYMASGLPVVATRVGAVPELVREGVTGVLVEPRDPDALAREIIRLLSDRTRARAMGGRGRELVESRFGLDSWAGRMEEFYAEVLDGKNGADNARAGVGAGAGAGAEQ